jgi:hypothetical protein
MAAGGRGGAAGSLLPRGPLLAPAPQPADVERGRPRPLLRGARSHRLGSTTGRLGGGHPPRDRAPGPAQTRLLTPAAGSKGEGAPLRVALPRQPPPRRHKAPRALRGARPRGDRGEDPRFPRRRPGVRPHDRRRLLPARLRRGPRRRAGGHRHRLHPPRPGLVPGPRDRRRAEIGGPPCHAGSTTTTRAVVTQLSATARR